MSDDQGEPKARTHLEELQAQYRDLLDERITDIVDETVAPLQAEINALKQRVTDLEHRLENP